MKLRSIALSVTALGALFAGGSFALRQDEGEMEFSALEASPEHEVLRAWEGTWDSKLSMMGMEAKGTYTAKLGMNDLWLVEDYEGEMSGAPFTGHGLIGYDADAKQYVAVWVDSWTTSLEPMHGTFDGEKKEMTMAMKSKNPMTGEEMSMKSVTRLKDRDNRSFHMFMAGPDGSEMETLTIEYTRRK